MRRRKITAWALVVVIMISTGCAEKSPPEASTYFLIRHAEKVRNGGPDPQLTIQGLRRADRWAEILGQITIHHVYSTNYKRTLATAGPTADKFGLSIDHYIPGKVDITDFLKNTAGHNTLVVGHSNTIPEFANALIGENIYKDIPDSVNGRLYIVTLSGGGSTHLVLNFQ